MCDHIDRVEPNDIKRVAARVFGISGTQGKNATIITMGSEDVPDWKSILRKYGVGER